MVNSQQSSSQLLGNTTMFRPTFDNFKVTKGNKLAFESAKKFMSTNEGLFLHGNVGCGKTHLAKATHQELLKTNGRYLYHSQFVSASELLLQIRGSFSNNWEREVDILEMYTRECLFLDDFGAQKISDFSIETIYLLIDRWSRKEKPKIFITSNLNLSEIGNTIGDRIASRITGMCKIVKIDEGDWRLKRPAHS